ncbi:MAG: bacillithiol system redox-active protein YtxJ [Vicinamibacterales bacterium]
MFEPHPPPSQAFVDVETLDDLQRLVDASTHGPIVIFKHSLTCGTSAYAREEVEAFAEAHPEVTVYLVRVQAARAVSSAIESRFRIRHESPQVLLVDQGEVRWKASHFRVTATAIAAALEAMPGSDVPSTRRTGR